MKVVAPFRRVCVLLRGRQRHASVYVRVRMGGLAMVVVPVQTISQLLKANRGSSARSQLAHLRIALRHGGTLHLVSHFWVEHILRLYDDDCFDDDERRAALQLAAG